MRKIIFTLALILSMTFSTTAQAFSFDWGVTGGYNLTKLNLGGDAEKYLESDNRSGWFVGAKANVGLALGFGLDGAFLYSQQKININNNGNDVYNSSETLRSFEIPVNLKYSLGLGKLFTIYATTGPQFNFNIGDSDWYYNNIFKRENVTTSWNIGAGTKLFGHLDLGIVYNFGISKLGETVLENITNENWHPGDPKANSFKVQLTYYF